MREIVRSRWSNPGQLQLDRQHPQRDLLLVSLLGQASIQVAWLSLVLLLSRRIWAMLRVAPAQRGHLQDLQHHRLRPAVGRRLDLPQRIVTPGAKAHMLCVPSITFLYKISLLPVAT